MIFITEKSRKKQRRIKNTSKINLKIIMSNDVEHDGGDIQKLFM